MRKSIVHHKIPIIQVVEKTEVLKLLDTSMIYPISDSSWVNYVHIVPKKWGMTIIKNWQEWTNHNPNSDKWRMCIDYRKVNLETKKYHFVLPYG